MAVSVVNLTSGGDADGTSSSTTASVSPSANKLELITVTSRTNISANPNIPTLTGNGLTWEQVNTVLWDTAGGSRKRVTMFRAMGALPSSGTITIDFDGQAQTHVAWVLDEFTNMDTTGTDGSGAIVQSAVNADTTGGATSLTVTLGAFSSANNATYGGFTEGNNVELTPGTNFSGIGYGTSGVVTVTTIFYDANDTTVDASEALPSELGGIAVEIKDATPVSGFFPSRRMLRGIGY